MGRGGAAFCQLSSSLSRLREDATQSVSLRPRERETERDRLLHRDTPLVSRARHLSFTERECVERERVVSGGSALVDMCAHTDTSHCDTEREGDSLSVKQRGVVASLQRAQPAYVYTHRHAYTHVGDWRGSRGRALVSGRGRDSCRTRTLFPAVRAEQAHSVSLSSISTLSLTLPGER